MANYTNQIRGQNACVLGVKSKIIIAHIQEINKKVKFINNCINKYCFATTFHHVLKKRKRSKKSNQVVGA